MHARPLPVSKPTMVSYMNGLALTSAMICCSPPARQQDC